MLVTYSELRCQSFAPPISKCALAVNRNVLGAQQSLIGNIHSEEAQDWTGIRFGHLPRPISGHIHLAKTANAKSAEYSDDCKKDDD